MDKKDIINAHDSYVLLKKAEKARSKQPIKENDILNILQVLQKNSREEAIETDEIFYVCESLFFVVRIDISEFLWNALHDGKVVFTNDRKWKLVK